MSTSLPSDTISHPKSRVLTGGAIHDTMKYFHADFYEIAGRRLVPVSRPDNL
jgi:hypothetical protein